MAQTVPERAAYGNEAVLDIQECSVALPKDLAARAPSPQPREGPGKAPDGRVRMKIEGYGPAPGGPEALLQWNITAEALRSQFGARLRLTGGLGDRLPSACTQSMRDLHGHRGLLVEVRFQPHEPQSVHSSDG